MAWGNRERAFSSWSFTRFSSWAECPARAAWEHLDKKAKHLPPSPPMERGRLLDEAGEAYLTGRTSKIHPELMPAVGELKHMRRAKNKIIQDNWGYNFAWEPVSSTDWDNCKLRIKIDFGDKRDTHLEITDLKTGKFREEQNSKYELQLDLYVAGAFAQLPDIKTASARLVYTDFNIVYPHADDMEVYTRAQGEKMQKDWDRRIKPMLADRKFQPRPGNYCRYCPFRKGGEVGGCKY